MDSAKDTKSSATPAENAAKLEKALFEIKRVIVGQDELVEHMFAAFLARGHCLIEGVPGVAKTLAVETMAKVVGCSFQRIQFTPDLVPSDIIGTRIYRASSETFDIELGPVSSNFVLADEINRAPAKVQSAMLEVMAEQKVSIGGETFHVPQPFLVMATQNPIEQEGVYPLPEAQRDRFLFKVLVDYPSDAEQREIVYRMGVSTPEPEQILSAEDMLDLQAAADDVFIHNALVDYAVRIVMATRRPSEAGLPGLSGHIQYGASPRASLGLIRATRAIALLRGRDYALPQDLEAIASDVLRHRLVLSYDAIADGVSPEQILNQLLSAIPAPTVTPRQGAQPNGSQPPAHNNGHAPQPPPSASSGYGPNGSGTGTHSPAIRQL